MRPIIGITPQITEDEKKITLSMDYVSMIEDNNGLASILSYGNIEKIRQQLKSIDGLLLSGGCDIEPRFFSEQPIKNLGAITPMRDEYELILCKTAIDMDMPVFGICRGIQIIAVATSGKIAQDIYDYYNNTFIIKHMQDAPRWYPSHQIFIDENSLFKDIFGCVNIDVNSFHHQAVSEVGKDITISATSVDGVIEAIEHKNKSFVIGVQWHPENMYLKNKKQKLLVQSFIDNCSKKV